MAGIILDHGNKILKIYIYTNSLKHLKAVKRFWSKQISSPFTCNVLTDPKWDYYETYLYPEKPDMIRMNNRAFLASLKEQGFDLIEMQPIVMDFRFSDWEKAMAFQGHATRNGFEQVIFINKTDISSQESSTTDASQETEWHLVQIQQMMKMTEEWLDTVTLGINELAEQYEGKFDDLRLAASDRPSDG